MTNKTMIKLLFMTAALLFASQTTNYAQNDKNTALDSKYNSQTEDGFSEQEEVRRRFPSLR